MDQVSAVCLGGWGWGLPGSLQVENGVVALVGDRRNLVQVDIRDATGSGVSMTTTCLATNLSIP